MSLNRVRRFIDRHGSVPMPKGAKPVKGLRGVWLEDMGIELSGSPLGRKKAGPPSVGITGFVKLDGQTYQLPVYVVEDPHVYTNESAMRDIMAQLVAEAREAFKREHRMDVHSEVLWRALKVKPVTA